MLRGRVLEWARSVGAEFWWGRGTRSGSAYINPVADGRRVWPFAIWSYGKIEVQFQGLAQLPEFEAEDRRRELQRKLNAIPGVSIGEDALARRPSFSLALLDTEAEFAAFRDALVWLSNTMGRALS